MGKGKLAKSGRLHRALKEVRRRLKGLYTHMKGLYTHNNESTSPLVTLVFLIKNSLDESREFVGV